MILVPENKLQEQFEYEKLQLEKYGHVSSLTYEEWLKTKRHPPEEKTSFKGIVMSGGCSESLQKKARKFSEKVSNGYHYMDLEVGFIRGYQSALNKALEWLENNIISVTNDMCICTASVDNISKEEFIEAFRKAMEE